MLADDAPAVVTVWLELRVLVHPVRASANAPSRVTLVAGIPFRRGRVGNLALFRPLRALLAAQSADVVANSPCLAAFIVLLRTCRAVMTSPQACQPAGV